MKLVRQRVLNLAAVENSIEFMSRHLFVGTQEIEEFVTH